MAEPNDANTNQTGDDTPNSFASAVQVLNEDRAADLSSENQSDIDDDISPLGRSRRHLSFGGSPTEIVVDGIVDEYTPAYLRRAANLREDVRLTRSFWVNLKIVSKNKA